MKNLVVTPYWVEKECKKIGMKIDHNQAEACLEALEAEDYGQLCEGEVPDNDERSAWELIRLAGPGRKWLVDPPEKAFDWRILGLIFGSALSLGILAWRLKNRRESGAEYAHRADKWVVVG